MQSPWANAPVRRRDSGRRYHARRGRDARSESGRQARRRTTARGGRRRRYGTARERGARAQHRFRLADGARHSLGAREARRQHRWITGPEARADGHAWRARACAVLTGVGTILKDDPRLTVRDVETTRQPLRVVVDRNADTPVNARLFDHGPVLLVTAGAHNARWPSSAEVLALPDDAGRIDLAAMLRSLAG